MKFFVSYSRSVQEPVRAIITSLRDDGEEVWWDQDLRAGQDWWATILDNIEQCQTCLFFVSEKSVQSPYCMEELRYALARNRLVLPYVMDVIAYTLPPEIMKGRIQYEAYNGTPDHIRERIRITTSGVKWDQYKDRYTARPPEPNTGTSDLVDRLDKAISLANEGYFDEAILGFKDVSNNDYDEYGLFCHDWIDKLNRYRDIAKLADRLAMRQLAKPKWEKFVEQYGDEFDPLVVVSKFSSSKKAVAVEPSDPLPSEKAMTAQQYFDHAKNRPAADEDGKIADYTETIRRDPNFAMAYFNRGAIYNSRGEYEQAVADFTQVIRLKPQDEYAYYSRGFIYHTVKDYDKAIADYSSALKLDSRYIRAYERRGDAYFQKAEYDKAIRDYDEVLKLNPDYPEIDNSRKKALQAKSRQPKSTATDMTAEDYLEQGKKRPKQHYDLKITDFTEAIRLNPHLTEAYTRRAVSYRDKGDYDRAIADYTEAIRLNDQSPSVYYNRAVNYASKQDYERALADYTEAIRLNPQYAGAHNNRAYCYLRQGKHSIALIDCNEAIRLDPKKAYAYDTRGDVYFAKGDYDLAIADYEKAISIEPGYSVSTENLKKALEAKARSTTSNPLPGRAEDYLEQGKKRATEEYDLKIADYTEAIRLNSRLTEAYLRRAGNYNAKEDYERALADYDEALRLEPDNFIAFNGRGLIHAALMQHNQAITDYSEAIQLAPQFADVYYNRGISYSSIGEYDQAISDYSEVIRLNPQFANAYNNRGNNYKLKGDDDHSIADYDRAIADYEQALRLDPRHPLAGANLKRAIDAKAR